MSNWAYMVMASLAWNLKAWLALWTPPPPGRWHAKHSAEQEEMLRMEFRTFVSFFIRIPCQIINTGRKLVYRLLGVECVARRLLSPGRPIRSPAPLLNDGPSKPESGCSGPPRRQTQKAITPHIPTKTCFVPTPRDGPPQSVRVNVLAYLSDRSDRWAFACLRAESGRATRQRPRH